MMKRKSFLDVSSRKSCRSSNGLRELYLIDRVPEELWEKVHNIVQEVVKKNHPQEKEMQKGKMAI